MILEMDPKSRLPFHPTFHGSLYVGLNVYREKNLIFTITIISNQEPVYVSSTSRSPLLKIKLVSYKNVPEWGSV